MNEDAHLEADYEDRNGYPDDAYWQDRREAEDYQYEEQYDDEPLECLEAGNPNDPCEGPVEYHVTGRATHAWPRCEHHQDQRQERYENSMEIYADSDVVPDWFDPSYAGERWFEDD